MESLAFIPPNLIERSPRPNITTWGVHHVARMLPRSIKNDINPYVSRFIPRKKEIELNGLTATIVARSDKTRYITGHPKDEGRFGNDLIGMCKDQASGGVLLDVGASMGTYTTLALHAGMHVVAFEPDPTHFEILVENVSMNQKYEGQIQMIDAALSDKEGLVTLCTDGIFGACPSMRATDGQIHTTQVPSMTIDDLITQGLIPRPTIVKIDVEGAEGLVLAGGKRFFSGVNAPDLFVELHVDFLPKFDTNVQTVWETITNAYGYAIKSVTQRNGQLLCHFAKPRHDEGLEV